MIPILYGKDIGDAVFNGIGRLSDCLSAVALEERNGQYNLTIEYPAGGAYRENIGIDSLIRALPSEDAQPQLFRVSEISKEESGVITIRANHISYDLLKKMFNPSGHIVSPGAQNALDVLKSGTIPRADIDLFSYSTDISSSKQWKLTEMPPGSVREMLGGVEGSILDTYGGEFEWDNLNVILHQSRGADNGVLIAYGKNLTEIQQDIDASGACSKVFPYYYKVDADIKITTGNVTWHAGNMLYLADQDEPTLDIPGATVKGVAAMDLTEYFEDPPTSFNQLREMAQAHLYEYSGNPSEATTARFVPLWQTIEYEDLPAQKVHLCDIVRVRYPGLDIDVTAKVTRTEFNVVSEKYNRIEVGTASTLYDTINDMISDADQNISKQNNLIVSTATTSSVGSSTTNSEVTSIEAPQDGIAFISGYVNTANNSTGSRHAEIQAAGTTVGSATVLAASGVQTRVSVSGIAKVSKGDSIKLMAWQNSGNSRNVGGALRAYFMS